jgi:hypothetical protein
MMFTTGRSIVMLGAALLLSVTPALTPDDLERAGSGLPYGLPQPCAAITTDPTTTITDDAIVDDAVICLKFAGR